MKYNKSMQWTLMMLSVVAMTAVVDAVPSDPNDRLIAQQLGEDNVLDLERHYRASYTAQDCLNAFHKVYARMEPLSRGWYGSVFRLFDHEGRSGYILKAIPLVQTSVSARILSHLGGIEPMDEVKVGRLMTERVLWPGYSQGGFLHTLDWFQCNHKALVHSFCRDVPQADGEGGPQCVLPKKEGRRHGRHAMDTQYIITREVPGPTAFDVIPDLFQQRPPSTPETVHAVTAEWIRRGVDFIRWFTASALFELGVAFAQTEFGHFDLNLKNFKLTPDAIMTEDDEQTMTEDDEHPVGYYRFELDPQTIYYIPKSHSRHHRMVIIDYGTSSVRLHDETIGPDMARRYTRTGSMAMNIRYALFSLLSYIPRRFFKHWLRVDPETYHEFADVFRQGGGFDDMCRCRGALAGYQTAAKSFRSLYMYGLPDCVNDHTSACFKEQFWYARAGYKVGTYTGLFQVSQESEGLSYEELLRMPFYQRAYHQEPVDAGQVTSLGRMPDIKQD